jgi:hypothetical protein
MIESKLSKRKRQGSSIGDYIRSEMKEKTNWTEFNSSKLKRPSETNASESPVNKIKEIKRLKSTGVFSKSLGNGMDNILK